MKELRCYDSGSAGLLLELGCSCQFVPSLTVSLLPAPPPERLTKPSHVHPGNA